MTNKALVYAETELEVHAIYKAARDLHATYQAVLNRLHTARSTRRELEEELSDREVDILLDETAKHPSMSATAMKDHAKKALQKDERHSEIRSNIRSISADVDSLEMEKSSIEQEQRIHAARMHELGGYLNYLAVVKYSSIVNHTQPEKPTQSEKPEDPSNLGESQ